MILVVNFLVRVVLAPVVLAGVAHFTTGDRTLVILSAVLTALSGLVSVWDGVIRPGPKLGADWRFPTPLSFLLVNLGIYGLAIPFVVALGLWAKSELEYFRDFPVHALWWLVLIPACTWVPQTKRGPDSGVPLSSD